MAEPSLKAPAGLEYTRSFAGGLRQDLARRLPHFSSDWRLGLHPKVFGSAFFLFFACLANAIAFGALNGALTGGQIGIVEMLLITGVGGIVYAAFSGQPLTLLGGTGPIVIFTALLYRACQEWQIPFLPVYTWVGLWSGLFIILCSVFDLSFLMRYFTRFTDEIFSALIAVIFIYEAADHLLMPFFHGHAHLESLFLALIVGLGTYQVARNLKAFGRTPYLRRKMREFLVDFGPAIAITLMTLITLFFPHIQLEVPVVPSRLAPTSGRPWLIPLFSLPWTHIVACALPALLATILLFLDQNITTRLVNAKQNRLLKGSGYHLDLLVVGLLIVVGSPFGLPWIVAATVHSLNHVRSLAETRVDAKTGRELIVSVRENRLSASLVHLGIFASMGLLGLIARIPMPVLYGLFLYMGLATLKGNQFFERLKLWAMDPGLYPKTYYLRMVPASVIHLFTAIQLFCLLALWLLKASRIGLLFPVLIAALVPLRLWMPKRFSSQHLEALDAEEEDSEDELD